MSSLQAFIGVVWKPLLSPLPLVTAASAVQLWKPVLTRPAGVWVSRTATQSRKKSRVPLSLLEVSRTRKLASLSSATVQVRPQVSDKPPRTVVCSVVVSWVSVWAAVQEVPPSQESSTLMLWVPEVLSSHQSSRTSIPAMSQSEAITPDMP